MYFEKFLTRTNFPRKLNYDFNVISNPVLPFLGGGGNVKYVKELVDVRVQFMMNGYKRFTSEVLKILQIANAI